MDKEPPGILERIDSEYPEYPEVWQSQLSDLVTAMRGVHRKVVSEDREGFSGADVITLNRDVLMRDYMLNPHLYGILRSSNVQIVSTINGQRRISSVIPADWRDLPQLFEEYSKGLESRTNTIDEDTPVGEVLDTAAWAHFELIRLHPFMEGNGRTARLLVDFIFARAGLPYITEWGSKNREYIETVYEAHANFDSGIFKKFLARKLMASVRDLEEEFGSLKGYTDNVKSQLSDVLSG